MSHPSALVGLTLIRSSERGLSFKQLIRAAFLQSFIDLLLCGVFAVGEVPPLQSTLRLWQKKLAEERDASLATLCVCLAIDHPLLHGAYDRRPLCMQLCVKIIGFAACTLRTRASATTGSGLRSCVSSHLQFFFVLSSFSSSFGAGKLHQAGREFLWRAPVLLTGENRNGSKILQRSRVVDNSTFKWRPSQACLESEPTSPEVALDTTILAPLSPQPQRGDARRGPDRQTQPSPAVARPSPARARSVRRTTSGQT